MIRILCSSRVAKNLGDVVINALLIRELLKKAKVYLKGMPSEDLLALIRVNNQNYDNLSVVKPNSRSRIGQKAQTFMYLLTQPKFDMVFCPPGHHSEDTNHLKTLIRAIGEIVKICLYKLRGTKYIKYGITLGPFKGVAWLLHRMICSLSFLVVVRDRANYEALLAKGYPHLQLKADLSFLLFENRELILMEKKNKAFEGRATISLRGALFGGLYDKKYFEGSLCKAIKLVQDVSDKKKLRQICVVYQAEADCLLASLTFRKMKEAFPDLDVMLRDQCLGLNDALKLYQESSIVITNRMHVFLFAMMCRTKAYVVTEAERHPKLMAVISDMELKSLVFDSLSRVNLEDRYEVDVFCEQAMRYRRELREHIASLLG